MKRAMQFVCMWIVFLAPLTLGFAQGVQVEPDVQREYVPLAQIPGLTDNQGAPDLNTYIQSIYDISIGIGVVLAILMLVIAGLQYSSSVIASGKSKAKERIIGALLGLLLLLSSVLILQTINPELATLDVNLTPVSIELLANQNYAYEGNKFCPAESSNTSVGLNRARSGAECYPDRETCNSESQRIYGITNCTNVRVNFNVDGENCRECAPLDLPTHGRACVGDSPGANACFISSTIKPGITELHNRLAENGINGLVTEGFPPQSHAHSNQCHYNGTCIDYDVVGGDTDVDTIATVIQVAEDTKKNGKGVTAIFETGDEQVYCNFVRKYPQYENNISYLQLSPHYSVYSGDRKKNPRHVPSGGC